MKGILLAVFLFIFGMSIYSQDLSFFMDDFTRVDGTFAERHAVLEAVRDSGLSDLGDFYLQALRHFLAVAPEIRTSTERETAERSAIILSQGLAAERHTAAGSELWQIAELFDPVRGNNEGTAAHAAIIALAQIDARDFIPHIVQRLVDFNTQTFRDPGMRLRVQLVVAACVNALEMFADPTGFSPVFFVYVGAYDQATRQLAWDALPNIAQDPGDVVIEIIRNPANNPMVKLEAWRVFLRTNAPEASRARVAAAALETGWTFMTGNRAFQTNLRQMRKEAIDAIRTYGAADNSVYTFLERSYSSNFVNSQPDFEEMQLTLNALAAINSEQSVALLHQFLRELHGRRRSGPWRNRERQLFEWVLASIGATGTQSQDVRLLLTTITRTPAYTTAEQRMAQNALAAITQ